MNTLILDCSAGMSVYLISKEKIFSHCDNNQKKHTDELLLVVDKLLNDANLKVKDINNICVCIGPGSFTGIRVAISVAKGLSIGTDAKIYTCSNFDICSYKDKGKSIYILDGFSKYVYARIVDGENFSDSCKDINELITSIKEKYINYSIYVQTEKLQNILKNDEIIANFTENNTILCFKDKINAQNYTQINQISPIYLRASQAEIERNERLKKAENNG